MICFFFGCGDGCGDGTVLYSSTARTCRSEARWTVAATVNPVSPLFPTSLLIDSLIDPFTWCVSRACTCSPDVPCLGHAHDMSSRESVWEWKRRDGRPRICGNEWNDSQLPAHRPCSHMLYTHHNQVINRHPSTVQFSSTTTTAATALLSSHRASWIGSFELYSYIQHKQRNTGTGTVCLCVGERIFSDCYIWIFRYLSINFIPGAFASLLTVIPVWGVRFVLRVDVWWVWMWCECGVRVWMSR